MVQEQPMKMRAVLFLLPVLFLSSLKSFAETCPRIQEINPAMAPNGWTFLIGPQPEIALDKYQFSCAIHSLNGYVYYGQVICRYDACPSYLCPAFTLISTKTYQEPSNPQSPWDHLSVLRFTLTCMPGDHNPAHCVFE